jgi:hypothetical protein
MGVDPLGPAFPVQVGPAEEREPVVVAECVVGVGETQGARRFEGIPAPADAAGVQVPHERRQVVQRRQVVRQVIAAARGLAADRVQPVGPGRAGHRAEPAIAHRELPGEVIVDRDIGGVVITHHARRIPILNAAARERAGKARGETVHRAAADLQINRAGRVIGIIGNRRAAEVMDGIAVPVVLVGELWTQTIDITAATLKRQIPEHVIERAVLEHQNDDVVDLRQVGHANLLSHHTAFAAASGDRGFLPELILGLGGRHPARWPGNCRPPDLRRAGAAMRSTAGAVLARYRAAR